MKTLKTILLVIITVLFINTANAQKEHKAYYDNGNLKEEGQFDSGGKGTGEWKFYSEYGYLNYTGSYEKGNPIGEWKFYNQFGWLEDIHDYKNDEKISLSKGCYYGDCDNGYGKKFLGWGKRQHGNFTNGVLNGEGTEISTLSGMSIYKGNFVNGKKDGQGIESFEPLRTKYVGQWKDGEKNGHGIETKHNFLLGGVLMEKYDGNWEGGNKKGQASITEYDSKGKAEKRKIVGDWAWNDNEPSGKGKEYINGQLVYEGTFENGKPFKTEGCLAGDCENGQGVFVFPDKSKYIGQFKNGKKNGLGFELDAKNGLYSLTNWEDDKVADGTLRIFNTNNEIVLVLEMKDGKPVAGLSDNGVEIGCLKGDCENGFGHYVWEGGAKYIGEFKDGLGTGYGIVTDANGKFVGKHKNYDRNGYGRVFNTNNVVTKQGRWMGGVFYPNLTIEKKYSKNEKCTVGNCIDGFGIFIETFEPGWSDGYKDYVNTYEIKYEGFWIDGEFHGIGYTTDRMNKSNVGLFEHGEFKKQ